METPEQISPPDRIVNQQDNLTTRLRNEVQRTPIAFALRTIISSGRGNGGSEGPCGVSMFIETIEAGEETYMEIPETEWYT